MSSRQNRKRTGNNNAANDERDAKRQRTSNSSMMLAKFKKGAIRPLPSRLVRKRMCVPYTDDTLTQLKGYGEILNDADLISRVPDILLDASPSSLAQIVDGGAYNYIMFVNPAGGDGYVISATYALPLEIGTKHNDIYWRLTPEHSMNYVCSGEFSFSSPNNSLIINEISSLFYYSENARYLHAAAVLEVAPDILQHIQYLVNNDVVATQKIPISAMVFKAGRQQQAEVLQHFAAANGDDVKLLSLIFNAKGYLCNFQKNFAMSDAYNRMFLEVVTNPFKTIFGPNVAVSYEEIIMSNSPQLKLTNSTKELFCGLKSPLNNKLYATQENCAANTNPTRRWCNQ